MNHGKTFNSRSFHVLPKSYKSFVKALESILPKDRVFTDPIYTTTYGTDAGFYRLIPKVVVVVEEELEVVRLLREARKRKLPVTFRAGGTSLSGQAVSDSILVRMGRGFKGYYIFDNAQKITLEPGVIGSWANIWLAEFGRKIGPDPASIDTARIGGIVGNNASGMCCGVAENTYKTIADIRLIFNDGTVLDTSDDKSRREFERKKPEVLQGLSDLHNQVKADAELSDRIRHKFKIKNTTGYSLNALVDFDDPFEILKHVVVGSEGTLAFTSTVTYNTVIEHAHKASALMLFPDMETACKATVMLRKLPVAAVELMDRPALSSVEDKPGMPESLKGLAPGVTALLVETRASSEKELNDQISEITAALKDVDQVVPTEFTPVPEEFMKLWAVRKGLFPAVGAVRKTGTTVIIEDVAFPIESLAPAALELQEMFQKYDYTEAIIFGHALEGNLHFVFTQAFDTPEEIKRYQNFMEEVATMVVDKYDGSLEAEHGTGRNMAPFVEMEWGKKAYELMKQLKDIFDPENILNPGVILNDDPQIYLKNLKPMPEAHEILDKCIECGFCEPVCPSRHLTFTPRHRIVGARESSRLEMEGKGKSKKWKKSYTYPGLDTCAADGLCAQRCPVGINTGSFVKSTRADMAGRMSTLIAEGITDHYGKTLKGVKAGLKTANLIHRMAGDEIMDAAAEAARNFSLKTIPRWNKAVPDAAKPMPKPRRDPNNPLKVVYFPSCISRSFGASKEALDKRSIGEVTLSILDKAGYDVIIPENLEGHCCGLPFASKGFPEQSKKMSKALEELLWQTSNHGEYPILVDTSPCLFHMQEYFDKEMNLLEPVAFVMDHLQKRLIFDKADDTVTVHATCSTIKMGLQNKLTELARLCCDNVVVPENINCCGFAGDRGFIAPELNKAALHTLKDQVAGCDEGYSTSRTCELGLTLHSGIQYSSILYLVDRCTRPIVQTREL